MSDRDVIIDSLAKAVSRIRANRLISSTAVGLCVFIGIAVFGKALSLSLSLGPTVKGTFWIAWLLGLTLFLIKSVRVAPSLSEAAAALDAQAGLKDEVVSAYWFLSQDITNPWVDLQIRRAAATLQKVNLRELYPRLIPKTSYLAAAGLVLLLALNWVPLPPGGTGPILNAATDTADSPEADEILSEIEQLLEQAEQLRPSPAIEEFQELIQRMQESANPLDESEQEMQAIEGLIDEGNLDIANLLEGLEEIGEDLSQSEDTLAAGQQLSEGEPNAAAQEFEALAERLTGGDQPAEDLDDALTDASENRRPGLEELATQLEAAAGSLQQDDLEALAEALNESALALTEVANAIESQRLQNEAAARMDALEEALRQQAAQQLSDLDSLDPPATQGEPLEMTAGADGVPQLSELQEAGLEEMGGMELSTGDEGEPGEVGEGGQQSGQTLENVSGDDSGMIPLGYGFSPEIKEGLPTSLDVVLQEEAVEAQLEEIGGDEDAPETEDLATRRENSSLDYRDVPSDLTPAQQELLNKDAIPREYQNLIKDYFEAIRPTEQ
jgi:hypothetical protein